MLDLRCSSGTILKLLRYKIMFEFAKFEAFSYAIGEFQKRHPEFNEEFENLFQEGLLKARREKLEKTLKKGT